MARRGQQRYTWSCFKCDCAFTNRYNLVQHFSSFIQRAVPDHFNFLFNSPKCSGTIYCKDCGAGYNSLKSLFQHIGNKADRDYDHSTTLDDIGNILAEHSFEPQWTETSLIDKIISRAFDRGCSCFACGETFGRRSELHEHLHSNISRAKGDHLAVVLQDQRSQEECYCCGCEDSVDGQEFTNLRAVLQHMGAKSYYDQDHGDAFDQVVDHFVNRSLYRVSETIWLKTFFKDVMKFSPSCFICHIQQPCLWHIKAHWKSAFLSGWCEHMNSIADHMEGINNFICRANGCGRVFNSLKAMLQHLSNKADYDMSHEVVQDSLTAKMVERCWEPNTNAREWARDILLNTLRLSITAPVQRQAPASQANAPSVTAPVQRQAPAFQANAPRPVHHAGYAQVDVPARDLGLLDNFAYDRFFDAFYDDIDYRSDSDGYVTNQIRACKGIEQC